MAADGWFATGMMLFARSRQNRPDRSAKAEGPRSRRRFGGTPSLLVEHPRQNGGAHEEPPRAVARSLSARDFRRRFPGGPRRLARQGRAQPLRGGDRAPQERVGGRISAMAEARFVGAPLRLRLGGRRLFAGAHGAAGRMHAGADGRDGGGQEGADRLSDGHAGERAKLEGAARRFEGARLGRRAASSHWRWRARVLEGPRRGVPDDASSGILAAQDIERARQSPEVDATQRAQGSARDLAVSEPGRGGSGDDDLRREIRAQIRQGSRMPDQGSSNVADVLRPSRRSLGPLANFEPDRERVRDSEASHRPHEGRAVAGYRASHGVQTGDGRVQDLATIARSKPVAESRKRYKIQRRNRSCRRNQIRRLIHAVTDFSA